MDHGSEPSAGLDTPTVDSKSETQHPYVTSPTENVDTSLDVEHNASEPVPEEQAVKLDSGEKQEESPMGKPEVNEVEKDKELPEKPTTFEETVEDFVVVPLNESSKEAEGAYFQFRFMYYNMSFTD
jgi:hypothetical protein